MSENITHLWKFGLRPNKTRPKILKRSCKASKFILKINIRIWNKPQGFCGLLFFKLHHKKIKHDTFCRIKPIYLWYKILP
ncbi:hypothetical protein EG343_15145 [Chryseobacterium nakagawai]|uniref:Uncharacterized protein n=1 Tax=Chryseobacterium nakagawai TaxID=1241982 RepID=A0AAD0YNU5_CHRNA|nr:hypothetical protein EG343_15145 [Chryseobacterium nakagawai]